MRTSVTLPLFTGISAGFPSPAADYLENAIDLNRELIRDPSSTFFGRVKGFSMKDEGIGENDILVIDKSIRPRDGLIAVCFIDGEFTLKKIRVGNDSVTLMPANDSFKPIVVTEENNFLVWGIVTYVIRKFL